MGTSKEEERIAREWHRKWSPVFLSRSVALLLLLLLTLNRWSLKEREREREDEKDATTERKFCKPIKNFWLFRFGKLNQKNLFCATEFEHRMRLYRDVYFYLFKWAIPGLFFFIFGPFYKQLTGNIGWIKVIDDWIRTTDFWCWKQLFYQLSHNQSPQIRTSVGGTNCTAQFYKACKSQRIEPFFDSHVTDFFVKKICSQWRRRRRRHFASPHTRHN